MVLMAAEGKEIDMPFREDMAEAVVDLKKECTSRTRKKGEPGDYFFVTHDGIKAKCVLYDVVRMRLGTVQNYLYKQEGFPTADGFHEIWEEIHPKKGFDDSQYVYVHFFWVKSRTKVHPVVSVAIPTPIDWVSQPICGPGCRRDDYHLTGKLRDENEKPL